MKLIRPFFGVAAMSTAALEIQRLHAWHDQQPIILDLNLTAYRGEIIVLLSTCKYHQLALLNCLFGFNSQRRGSIRIHQAESIHLGPQHISRLGMALSSKSTGILPDLSCEENLLMPLDTNSLGGGLSLTEIYLLFPLLSHYKGAPSTHLTPGELQLLALARVLRTGADIIVLSNLYADLCPTTYSDVIHLLTELKQRGYTLILNEHSIFFAAQVADRIYHTQHQNPALVA